MPGAVSDLGAHLIDLARLYMGDVARVTAQPDVYRPWL